jgi:hypothetical protein
MLSPERNGSGRHFIIKHGHQEQIEVYLLSLYRTTCIIVHHINIRNIKNKDWHFYFQEIKFANHVSIIEISKQLKSSRDISLSCDIAVFLCIPLDNTIVLSQ